MYVRSVSVGPERVDVVVELGPHETQRTDPSVAERAVTLMPALGRHRCVNEDGIPIGDELADTEVPHLFEHVVLELMALSGSPRDLRGHTYWDFRTDGEGVFHVSLEFDDDLVCLGAIKTADGVMRYLLAGGAPPDVPGMVDKLRLLRSWPV